MAEEHFSKLKDDVKKFLEVYKFLSVEGKAHFEAQMEGEIKAIDEKTKNLYRALLKAAKDGKSIEQAIESMGEITG